MKKFLSFTIIIALLSQNVVAFASDQKSCSDSDEIISGSAVETADYDTECVTSEPIYIDLSKPYNVRGTFSPYSLRKAALYGSAPLYRDIMNSNAGILYDEIKEKADVNSITNEDGRTLVTIKIDTAAAGLNFDYDDIWYNNSEKAGQDVFDALYGCIYDNPEINWFTSCNASFSTRPSSKTVKGITLRLFTIGDTNECSGLISSARKWRDEVTAEASTLQTNYDKLKYVHDLICNKVSYGYDPSVQNSLDGKFWYSHSLFGVSSGDKVVCEGYTKAFKYICDALNIPCIYHSGDGETQTDGHAWNIVQPDNDMWYYTDLTWDDSDYGVMDKYFLCGRNVFDPTHYELDYYNNFGLPISEVDYVNPHISDTETTTETGEYLGFSVSICNDKATITGYNGDINKGTDFVIPAVVDIIEYIDVWGNGQYLEVHDQSDVVSISPEAFKDMDFGKETNIIISEGIQKIGSYAFSGIKAKSISIPKSIIQIDKAGSAFYYADIDSVDVNSENSVYCSDNGILFSKNQRILYSYPGTKQESSYTVPDVTNELADMSFAGAKNLSDLFFNNVRGIIQDCTFSGDTINLHFSSDNTLLRNKIKELQAKAAAENTDKYGNLTFEEPETPGTGENSDPSTEPTTAVYDRYTYKVTDGKAEIIYSNVAPDPLKDFEVPAELNGYPVTKIGQDAFNGINVNNNSIILPEGIISVADGAFRGAYTNKFILPASLETIGDGYNSTVFSYSSARGFYVDPANPYFCSENGVLLSKDKTVLYNYPPAKQAQYYVAPSETTVLVAGSFGEAVNLKDVYLYNNAADLAAATVFNKCTLTVHGTADNTNLQSTIESIQSLNNDTYGHLSFAALKEGDPTSNIVEEEPAEETTATYGDYTIKGADGKATIVDYTGTPSKEENFVIPSDIGGFRITAIGNSVFDFIDIGDNDIIIPEGVETLGTQCFWNAKARRAVVPSTVKTLVGDTFAYIFSYAKLEEIVVDKNNPYFCSEDGVFLSKDKTTLYNYPTAKSASYYVAPAETTTLACTSFARASNLKDIYFYSPDVQYSTFTFAYDTVTIHAAEGSTNLQSQIAKTQEKAAAENTNNYGILSFEVLKDEDPKQNETNNTYSKGDINGDGTINSRDSLILFKYIAGDSVTVDETLVDFNNDGYVDSRDSLILFKYVAGDSVTLN